MRYLLDTNIISALIKQPRGAVGEHVTRVGASTICTSVVVAGELRYGAARKGSARLSERIEALLGAIDVLSVDDSVTETYARVRLQLERAGTPIGGNDLWIAASALRYGCTVVTANTKEFRRVAGLGVEDWLQ